MSHHLRRSKVSARPLSAVVVACLLAVFIAAPAGAVDAAPTFIAPGTSSWTVPAGVTSISIECWGGGGGGGTDSSNTSGGAGGGGGGAYAKVYSLTVTPGTVYTYTVGAAGSAAPTAGGNSSFNGLTCVAAGGAAGTSANNGNGGAGGTVLGSAGDIRFPGGAGAAGGNSNGGGGGSSAGPNTLSTIVPGTGITGTNGSGISGGTTVPGGGPGGSGGSGSNGNPPGSGPGGGGGGGEYASPPNGTRAGGAGYAGQVRIRYNATLSVDTPSVTYNGSSQSTTVSASVAGTVSNIKYNGSSTAPTAAGTYAITADFVPTDAANYNTFSGVTAGTFTINKAATTTTVTCTAGPFTYDGTAKTPCSATVTGPNNLNQTVAVTYVNNTNAGTATANANYAGGASYLASTGSTNFTIGKAATTTTVTCTAGPFSYDGTAKTPCSAAATGPGLNQSLTAVYTDNINAGTATASASYAPVDPTNYLPSSGSKTFTISKASTTTTVTCSGGPFTDTGSEITPSCTAAATGVGGLNQTGLTVSFANNINAGTATASATYAGTANYLASNGSTPFTIGKATPTIAVQNPSSVTYNGSAQAATVIGSVAGIPSNVQYSGSGTAPTNAGTYAITADFAPTDSTNYNTLSGASAGNFTINKATPTLSVTNSPVTFNGAPQDATLAAARGVATVLGSFTNVQYGGSGTAPTDAGTYAVTADFAPIDSTNYNSVTDGTAGSFVIDKATPTLSVTNSPVTFNGAPQDAALAAARGLAAVPGSFTNVQYGGSGAPPTDAGTYAVTADFAPTDAGNYNSLSGATAGSLTIGKAPSTTAVNCGAGSFTYTGAALTPCTAGVTGVGGFSQVLTVDYTDNTSAGTAGAAASFTGNTNFAASSDSTTFIIGKAASATTVTCTGGPFVYQNAPFTPCSATLTGAGGLTGSPTVSYSSNTDAGTASASASFAGDANHLGSSGSTTFAIDKATPVLAVSNPSVTYTGLAQAASVVGSAAVVGPVDGTASNVKYGVSSTAPADAGTYAITADFTPADTDNYNSLSGATAGNFVIGKATSATTVTCTAGPFVYKNAPFTPCSATLTGAGGLTGSPAVSYSNNTDAGTASASASYDGDANHLGSSGSTTFTIDKATPTISLQNPSVTYSGSAQEATVLGSVLGTASNVKYNTGSDLPVNAGTYAITADFTPDDITNYKSLTGAPAGDFTIGKAASTTTVSCGAGPFTYTGSAITPCTATLTGAGGLTGSPAVSYSNNTDVGTASASAGFAGDDNYLASSDSKTFAIAKATSTTTVTCDPGPFVYKNAAFTPCAATLTGAGGLTGSPEVSYSSNVDAGTATASAGYAGDANHEPSSGSKNFTIDKATPVLAVSNSPVTYNGAAQGATVTGSAAVIGSVAGAASNVKYGGSDTVPADAGTYAITADFTPADTGNYNSVTGAAAGDFVIEKAATTTAVTCSGGPFVYQNAPYTPCSAIVTGPPNLNQALTVNYANNTAAGTASANASFGGSANYQPSSDSKNFTIDKATPTISVQNPSVTYNGAPQLAIVNGSVAGASNSIKYDGADTAPTDAGTYAVTADFAPTDTGNYISLSGAMAGSFTIAKANPTLSLNNPVVGYDGTAHAAEVIGSVDGTPSNVKYNGSDVVPSDAGTYAITADFAPANGTNHNSLVGASAGNFVIQKAGSPVLSVDNPSATYDGQPHPAVVVGSIPGTPSNVLYNGSATVPTDAGTYVITADYAPGDPNYNSVTGEAAGTLVIAKAATTTAVTCGAGPFTYTGTAFTPCAATVTGPGNLNGVVTVSYSNNVNAGTAAANADYAGSANYLPSSDGKTFPIAKADPGLTVHNSPVTYNGTAQTADVRGSVGGTVSNIRYNGSATAPINAGTYAITADFAPEDTGNYNTLNSGNAGNFVIQKAGTPVLTVNNPTVTFDGAPHAATIVGSVAGTPSNIKYNGSATVPVNAGTYIITADYTPTDTTNYDAVTGASAGSLTIAKAPTATTVTCESGPFTYTGAAITPCTAGVTGPGGLNQAVTVTYVGNVNAGTAAANAAYAGATNYQQSSGAATFTIDQAATTTTITCGTGPFTYTGSAIEPCAASATGPGGLNHTVAVGYADNTNSGTASASASFEGSTNYLPSSGAATFTIGRAATTTAVSCQAGPFTYNGTAFTPCAASVTGPGGLSQAAAVSYSGSTNAGTASASASFAGGANYLASSGAATFTIDKAATTTVITCDPGPFSVTGLPVEPCTARVTGPAGLDAQLAMSYSNNVNAGTATASASYAGAADYLPSSDSEVFVIGEAVESTVFLHLPYMSK
ncbi:MAG: MBG domain-containing protein [Caldilineaceae bacterium]